MISLTLEQIAQVVGGTLHGTAAPGPMITGPAVIDSRETAEGALFAAIVGERTDGHDHAAAAYEAGAAAVLGSRPVDGPCVVVDDVVEALTTLARYVRDHLDAVVIGLTGSVGKTTTKDLIAQILEREGPTVATDRSYNNEIGLPVTVLRADERTRYLVLEMGAGNIGDIEYLARIARPRLGLVLCVGPAHLPALGGIDGVVKVKSELVRELPPAEEGGVALLNADDANVAGMAELTSARVAFHGTGEGVAVRASDVTTDAAGHASFTLHTPSGEAAVRLGLPGAHQVANALAAANVANALGIPADRIAGALSGAERRSSSRFEITERPDGVTVIDDAYNASLLSVLAAVRTAASVAEGKRLIAVLGEMTGEGEEATSEHHARVGALVAEVGIADLVVVGAGAGPNALAVAAREGGVFVHAVPDKDAAIERARSLLRSAEVVLVKASSEIGLSAVAAALKDVPA